MDPQLNAEPHAATFDALFVALATSTFFAALPLITRVEYCPS
jgi:hypothetical protein